MIRTKHIAGILGRMLMLLFAVSMISFILITNSPIDPLVSYVGTESTLSQAAKEAITQHWGLSDPLPERYLTWFKNLLQGDFGTSITYKRPVIDVIQDRFFYSVVLMTIAWTLSGIVGFIAGIAAGLKRDSVFDRAVKVFCLGLQSAPSFWLGLLILSCFSVSLGWFPIGMAAPMGKLASQVTLGDRVYHLVLPAFTLTIVSISKITLYTRQKLIEIMNSDFILFAKARGENTRQLVTRHVIKTSPCLRSPCSLPPSASCSAVWRWPRPCFPIQA